MELVNSGDSIEAQHAKVYGKKIVPQSMIMDKSLGRLRKYTVDRDGAASVEKELSPKRPIYKTSSRVDFGDKLKCLKFFILAKEISLRFQKTPFSGAHNTNYVDTKDYTFAEISYPFKHIVNALEKRNEIALTKSKNLGIGAQKKLN